MRGFILLAFLLPVAASAAAEAASFGPDAWNWIPKWKRWGKPRPPVTAGRARITLLDTGRIVSTTNGNGKNFEYVPTITLIEDGSNKIIFDTGLPTDGGSFKRMTEGKKKI